MAGAVQHAKLETRTARARLQRGRQPHWQAVIPGRAHLGYQRREGKSEGRWLLRRYVDGRYTTSPLGRADDVADADGQSVFSCEQARAAANAMLEVAPGAQPRITVRGAYERYTEFKRTQGQPVGDLASRARVHILPTLGHVAVADLTAERLRRWLADMAAAPAQKRPRGDKPQYHDEPRSEEDVRRRRATANRVLGILKALLNHAHDEGHVGTRDAWGRKLKPYRGVGRARVRYLTAAQAKKLIAAADPHFAPLVRAALETGCRYGELARLEVSDFDGATISVRRSKAGKARTVVLTEPGAEFFKKHCAGRAGSEVMFTKSRGKAWGKSHQSAPMLEACARAGINPPIGFHGLRHTYASLCVMNGVPLFVIAKNLGHATTQMVEVHYGHLGTGYVVDAIRKGAPRFG
jgi:integrase